MRIVYIVNNTLDAPGRQRKPTAVFTNPKLAVELAFPALDISIVPLDPQGDEGDIEERIAEASEKVRRLIKEKAQSMGYAQFNDAVGYDPFG